MPPPRKKTARLRPPSRRLREVADARHLFDRIPEPDSVSYNTLLACHLVRGDVVGARELLSAMKAREVASWNTMVSGLWMSGAVFLAMPAVSWNPMVTGDMGMAEECFRDAPERKRGTRLYGPRWCQGFMDAGNVEKATEFFQFQAMPVRNLVSWDAVVAGYAKNSRAEDALRVFNTVGRDANALPAKRVDGTKQCTPWMQQLVRARIREAMVHQVAVECESGCGLWARLF